MRIACAFDHAGFPLKQFVLETLGALGHETVDLGTCSTESGRLPGHRPGSRPRSCAAGTPSAPSLVCGSGAGVAVAACKFPEIRAVVAHDTYTAHQCGRARRRATFSAWAAG